MNPKLAEYLAAPAHVQAQFDRRIREQIEADLDAERYIAAQESDDPVAPEPPSRSIPTRTVRWDERWSERAKSTRKPDGVIPYDRDADPLLDVDLREVWDVLTGEDVIRDRSRCPMPDHPDVEPACRVYADGFRCFACGSAGSIIDLGAAIYAIEPRGKGFHDIRRQLMADLGLEERRAA